MKIKTDLFFSRWNNEFANILLFADAEIAFPIVLQWAFNRG